MARAKSKRVARARPSRKGRPPKPPVKPKKKPAKITAAAKKRKAAIARRRARADIQASIAASERAAKQRTGRTHAAEMRAAEREADRVSRDRQLHRRADQDLIDQLLDAYERMRETSPVSLSLTTENAPVVVTGTQPWLLLGTFAPVEPTTYAELDGILRTWEDDLTLEVMINPDRYAWIRIVYQEYDEDGDPVGKPEGYAPTSAGPWASVISETRSDFDITDAGSVSNRYQNSTVGLIEVYLSANLGKI